MASILDSLFAPFNTSSQDAAAKAQQDALMTGWQQYSGYNQQAQQALQKAYDQYQQYINQYFPQAQGAITAGMQPAQANTAAAQQGAGALSGLLQNLMGTGANPASALTTLQNVPGYEFAKQQGENAVLANQAKTGQLASGNTNLDLSNYVTGLASQNYNNVINQVLQGLGLYQGAAGQGAGQVLQGGEALGGNIAGQGTALGAGAQNLGSGLSQLLTGAGTTAYGTEAGIGNAQANAALAPLQAGNNMWNLIGNIAKLGVGGGGSGGGGGGTLGGNFLQSAGQGASGFGGQLFGGFNPATSGYNVTGGIAMG